MDFLYLIVPVLNLLILGFLIYLLWRVHKLPYSKNKKQKRTVLVVITIAFIFIGGFFSWSFTQIAIYPKIIINGQTFVWNKHHYKPTDSFDVDKIPYSNMKKVAFEELKGTTYGNNLFHYVFFPYEVYEEKNDPKHKVIWVLGLMDYEKYVRVD